MRLKRKPDPPAAMDATPRFPHCDSNVLHAPGECVYCDGQPGLQSLRERLGINFTGHYDEDKEPCPAEMHRDLDTINRWPGNTPRTSHVTLTDVW